MPTLATLVKRFSKAGANRESIERAALRARAFVAAALEAGLTEEVTAALREPKLVIADGLEDLAGAAAAFDAACTASAPREGEQAIVAAEARFGEPLPETVRELWSFLAHPARARFVRGVVKHTLVTPDLLVAPPDWGDSPRLTCITEPDSLSDVSERFADDYEEWFADAKPKSKVSKPKDLDGRKIGAMVMLDPARKQSIIPVAYWHSEQWFVVHDLRSKGAPAPVFSNHDDDEGLSRYLARDVRDWFSWEISRGIESCVAGD